MGLINDREEGWFDPRHGMLQEEQDELDCSVQPVWLVLVKVSSNSAATELLYSHCSSYENSPLRTLPPSSGKGPSESGLPRIDVYNTVCLGTLGSPRKPGYSGDILEHPRIFYVAPRTVRVPRQSQVP